MEKLYGFMTINCEWGLVLADDPEHAKHLISERYGFEYNDIWIDEDPASIVHEQYNGICIITTESCS